MRFENARRLTGLNPLLAGPGAAVEHLYGEGDDARLCLETFQAMLARAHAALGLEPPIVKWRDYLDGPGGRSLGVPGPIDQLYAEVDLIEWVSEVMAGSATLDAEQAHARYREQAEREANPALLALQAAAAAHDAVFLWDDDLVTVGMGPRGRTWPVRQIPTPDTIDWAAIGRVPVALVTGTNGKTTTTRMIARILKQAGHVVGTSSTDAISVDEQVIEAGDWTGPGAARTVLRRPEIDMAVLETARGGILRRGLALDAVDVGLVTNVAEDHFGDWGIYSLDAMAQAKALVWQAVRPGGARIVNAADPLLLVHTGLRATADWVMIARDEHELALADHRAAGGRVWFLRDGVITRALGPDEVAVIDAREVPATFGGAAVHNVDNALAAASAAAAMGADDTAIRAGLMSFGRLPSDNPGRLQLHVLGDTRVLLDFSHNPHGVDAVRPIIRHLVDAVPGARLSICLGQAGDRSDHDLAAFARATLACGPEVIWLRPLPGYERGRGPGESAAVLRQAFVALGLASDHIHDVADEVDALERASAWARPGDLLVHFVHIEREAVTAWLDRKARW